MAWHSFWARGSSSHHALPYHIPRSTGNILQSTGNILRNSHLVDSRACYLSRIRYNNQLALRCISNQTCSSITREAFFTFLGERFAVVKKKTQGFNMWPQVRRIGSLFFYRFYTRNVFTCAGIGWTSKQLPFQLTVYSQSSKRVRISWQLGRFSGSAQQSAPNEKQ